MSLQEIIDALEPMRHNALRNYIIPGVTSHLIGGDKFGKVRLFEAGRSARDFVTPHSHRFDFTCLVLTGDVRNTLYCESGCASATSEQWCISTINQVCGANGIEDYAHVRETSPTNWFQITNAYKAGDTYSMRYDEIHSIQFDRGTQVLFFEGPPKVTSSRMLEPWIDGKVVPTFTTESWMFQRDGLGKTGSQENKS